MLGDGIPSAPVMVLLDDGQECAAQFWQSSLDGQPPKWYVSRDVYGNGLPWQEICQQVVGWTPIAGWTYLSGGVFIWSQEMKQMEMELRTE